MIDGIKEIEIARSGSGAYGVARDLLAVEEPLEIRVEWTEGTEPRVATVAVTMRTPGNDVELAAGFLFTEGLVRAREQVLAVRSCRAGLGARRGRARRDARSRASRAAFVHDLELRNVRQDVASALRTTSRYPLRAAEPIVGDASFARLPERLRDAQPVFDATGGLHAVGALRPRRPADRRCARTSAATTRSTRSSAPSCSPAGSPLMSAYSS